MKKKGEGDKTLAGKPPYMEPWMTYMNRLWEMSDK